MLIREINITATEGSIVNVHSGNGGTTTNTTTESGKDPDDRWWKLLGWIIAILLAFISAYGTLAQWLHWPRPW